MPPNSTLFFIPKESSLREAGRYPALGRISPVKKHRARYWLALCRIGGAMAFIQPAQKKIP